VDKPHICDGDVGPSLHQEPAAAPEPSFVSKSRPAVGFLALLSDEQKRLLLSVNVNDCLGSKDDMCPLCGKPIKFKEDSE
jgi:hypothetical protein